MCTYFFSVWMILKINLCVPLYLTKSSMSVSFLYLLCSYIYLNILIFSGFSWVWSIYSSSGFVTSTLKGEYWADRCIVCIPVCITGFRLSSILVYMELASVTWWIRWIFTYCSNFLTLPSSKSVSFYHCFFFVTWKS